MSKAQEKLDRKLYDAVKKNKIELVHRYLRDGADPDAPVGKGGVTAMTRAAKLKDRQVEIALLNQGGTLDPTSSLAARNSTRRPGKARGKAGAEDAAGGGNNGVGGAGNGSEGEEGNGGTSRGGNGRGSGDGGHWIADSHNAGPASPEAEAEARGADAFRAPSLHSVSKAPSGGSSPLAQRKSSFDGTKGGAPRPSKGNQGAALRQVGNERVFAGSWLYVKKVVERVATVAVSGITLVVTPYPFGKWRLEVKHDKHVLGERMLTIEGDLLNADAASIMIGPATFNVSALTWLLDKECRELEADKRKAQLDFTSSPMP